MTTMGNWVIATLILGVAVTGQSNAVEQMDTGPEPAPAIERERMPTGTQHQVKGAVSEIDYDKGLLTLTPEQGLLGLKSEPAKMRLHFPKESVRNLKPGDLITTMLSFSTGIESNPRAFDAPEIAPGRPFENGRHRMSGTITAIDHQKGVFDLRTDAGTLTLQFPASAVRDLKEGDEITMQVAFMQDTPQKDAPPLPKVPQEQEGQIEPRG